MIGREIIWHNFWWKLLALFLATVVWFTFHSGDKLEFQLREFGSILGAREFVQHPLTLMIPAAADRQFKVDPMFIDLTLSGEKEALKKLTGKDLQAFVNLSDVTNGTGFVKVEVLVPKGIKVDRVLPSEARYVAHRP
jgi:hypothetical protein